MCTLYNITYYSLVLIICLGGVPPPRRCNPLGLLGAWRVARFRIGLLCAGLRFMGPHPGFLRELCRGSSIIPFGGVSDPPAYNFVLDDPFTRFLHSLLAFSLTRSMRVHMRPSVAPRNGCAAMRTLPNGKGVGKHVTA